LHNNIKFVIAVLRVEFLKIGIFKANFRIFFSLKYGFRLQYQCYFSFLWMELVHSSSWAVPRKSSQTVEHSGKTSLLFPSLHWRRPLKKKVTRLLRKEQRRKEKQGEALVRPGQSDLHWIIGASSNMIFKKE
jgi:hypothetical protein